MAELKEGVVGGALNVFFIYKFLRILTQPFNETDAFKLGIIDEKGKILKKHKKLKTDEEKDSYTLMHRLVWKLKRLLEKISFGKTRLASYAAALWLIKESHKFNGTDEELQESFLSFLETDWENDARILKENYEGDMDKKTYKNLKEGIDIKKADMKDVIKDFQSSDAPQFKGKSDKKKKEMAIAAKLSKEEVEIDEESKPNQMKPDELLKIWNKLKSGKTVKLWYDDAFGGYGTKWKEFKVGRKTASKKYNLEKITLQLVDRPGGVKHYLYNRQGKISMAIGDLATTLTAMKEEVELGEAFSMGKGDKRVVDAFYDQKEIKKHGASILTTDGKTLTKTGMGGQDIAKWVNGKIKIVAVSDVKSTEQILRYMKKSIPSGVFEEVEIDEEFWAVIDTAKKGEVMAISSDEKGAHDSVKHSTTSKYDYHYGKDPKTLKVVSVMGKHSQKKAEKMIGTKLSYKEEVEIDEKHGGFHWKKGMKLKGKKVKKLKDLRLYKGKKPAKKSAQGHGFTKYSDTSKGFSFGKSKRPKDFGYVGFDTELPGKQIKEAAVLDIKDVDKWVKEIKNGIKAGWVSVGSSNLGGDENVAILIKVTVEPEKDWPNKILHNARFGMIRIATDGTMEMFASGHKIKNMRKTKIKSARDVVSKINTWIKVVDEEVDPHVKVMIKKGDGPEKIKKMHPEITDDELKELGISETVRSFNSFLTEGRPSLDPDYVPARTQTDAMRAKLLSTQKKLYSVREIENLARKYKVKLMSDPVGGKSWGGDWQIELKKGINLEYQYGPNSTYIKGWKFDKNAIKNYIEKYANEHETPRDYAPMGGKVLVGGFETAFELIGEEAPANSVAGGNVNLDPFVKKKRKNAKIQTETFGGKKVFVVSPERFFDSRLGKSRYSKYEKYVGNDKLGEAIRQYGRANPKASIILKNSGNGAMLYLKYGRK